MRDIIERLQAVEAEIAAEKGPFLLFALFLRENSALGLWDLVVSAPWTDPDRLLDDLGYVASKLQAALRVDEMLQLSRIVLIDSTNPNLEAVHQAFSVEHGLVEFTNRTFFGLDIERGYVITSRREAARQAALAGAPA